MGTEFEMEDNDFLPPRKKKKDYLLPSPALINTLPIVELQQARQTVEAAAENADCEIRIRTYRFLAGTWKMFYGSFTCEVCDGCVAKIFQTIQTRFVSKAAQFVGISMSGGR